MADILIINAATGERIERDFTPEEIAQRAVDAAAAEEARAAAEQAELERVAARESAMAKLALLGLSDVEVAAIIGGSA
jgi:hypothetical protein